MNIPNIISLLRIPFLFICVILLYSRYKWSSSLALVFYMISAVSDWLDGYLARKYQLTSKIGAFTDALTDKIFMLGIMVTMLSQHILPEWSLFLVLTIFLREFLITGLRAIAATRDIVIPAQKEGKMKTVCQMISIGLILLCNAFRTDFITVIPENITRYVYFLGIFLFTYATYLTVTSGIIYLKRFSQVFQNTN